MNDQENNPYRSTGTRFGSGSIEFENFDGVVRVCQIIVFALTMGLVFFTGYTIYNFSRGEDELNWSTSPFVIGGWALAAGAIPASFMIPVLISNASQRNSNSGESIASVQGKLMQVYQIQLIVGCAILEGPAFLNTAAFMESHHPGSAAAAIVLAVVLLARMPTRSRVQAWLARRMEGR